MSQNGLTSLLDGSLLPQASPSPNTLGRRRAVIEISGMKCHSCVNNIQDNIASKDGIYSINVSLSDRQAVVEFDENKWSNEDVVDAIESMGFDAKLLFSNEVEESNWISIPSSSVFPYKDAYVDIRGMTCHSCVKNIQDHIGSKDGIKSVVVSLADAEGRVTFDPAKWTAESVVEAIDDMGFDAELKRAEDSQAPASGTVTPLLPENALIDSNKSSTPDHRKAMLKAVDSGSVSMNGNLAVLSTKNNNDFNVTVEDKMKKCTVSIQGMTCASCVAFIERNIAKVKGVESIVVALMASKAEVVFDSAVVEADQIVNEISQLGYQSSLLDCGTTSYHTINLQLGGLSTSMDAKRVESHVIERKGVESCTVLPIDSTACVEYSPTLIGPRDIIRIVEGLGYSAVLLEDGHRLKGLDHSAEIAKWKNSLLISLLFGVPVMGIMIYFHWFLHTPMNPDNQIPVFVRAISLDNLLLFALCTPIQIIGGRYFYEKSWRALKHRTSNMDVLIVLATSVAYIYSISALLIAIFLGWSSSPMTFFDVPPMLIVFVSLGRWLEHKAKGRTSEALSKLMSLQAKEALLITRDEENRILSEERLDIDLVQRGDLIKIVPGEKIPMDGVVIDGKSTVDESFITGEFMPVLKRIGSAVISGSVNQNGTLVVQVTHISQESTLAQIVHLVEQAQTSKAPIQQVADRIAGYFVPAVVTLALLTVLSWIFVGYCFMENTYATSTERLEAILKRAFEAAITVLAIACPCSLGLATPTAVMVGTGIGASNGILIKGGEALEMAHKVTTVVMDKTGTVTEGRPRLLGINSLISNECLPLRKMFAIIGSAESNSEHPVASSITTFAKEFLKTDEWAATQRFHASAGNGLSCEVLNLPLSFLNPGAGDVDFSTKLSYIGATIRVTSNNVELRQAAFNTEVSSEDFNISKPFKVVIGNDRWLLKNGIAVDEAVIKILRKEQSKGLISVLCAINGHCVAILSITDIIKSESRLAVWGLQKMGIRVVLLTGDNACTAEVTARQVGISEVFAEVLPNQKQLKIEQLQGIGEVVAMVGDGINDSPALASADVGIAIAAGSDVAIESAGIVLVKNDLIDVVGAIKLSKKTTRRIHLNFLFAVFYNAIGIPIAAGALLPFGFSIQPWMAAAAMAMSSVSVLTSSLLLKMFKKPTQESLATWEFRKHEAKVMMGDFNVKVHRGLDDLGVRRTTSKLSVASVLSGISTLFGSQQNVNRIRPKDRIRLLGNKSCSDSDYQEAAHIL